MEIDADALNTVRRCSCTHEAADSDCAEHPTCNNCGASLKGTKLAWLAAHAKVMARAADNEKTEAKEMRKQRDTALARVTDLERELAEVRSHLKYETDWVQRNGEMNLELIQMLGGNYPYGVLDAANTVITERDSLRTKLATLTAAHRNIASQIIENIVEHLKQIDPSTPVEEVLSILKRTDWLGS